MCTDVCRKKLSTRNCQPVQTHTDALLVLAGVLWAGFDVTDASRSLLFAGDFTFLYVHRTVGFRRRRRRHRHRPPVQRPLYCTSPSSRAFAFFLLLELDAGRPRPTGCCCSGQSPRRRRFRSNPEQNCCRGQ